MNSGLEGIELDTLCQRRMIRKKICSEENLVARCELSKMAGSSLEIKYKRWSKSRKQFETDEAWTDIMGTLDFEAESPSST